MPLGEVLNLDGVLSLPSTTISKLFIHDSHKSEVQQNNIVKRNLGIYLNPFQMAYGAS